MKFLHTGDLHLGQKLSSQFSKEIKERLKEDEKLLLSNIISYAEEKNIPYIFIAGDLFDTNKPSEGLISFVVSEFEKYSGMIFITPGNHDYNSEDSVYSTTGFPDNVYIFSDKITLFETDEALIYGYGFNTPHINEDSFSGFKADEKGKPKILVTHTDFTTNGFYNPIAPSAIESSGLSYIAAGHIHLREEAMKRGKTYANYCGSPQNLNFKEAGESCVIIGDISEDFLEISKVDLSCHRYLNLSIDLSEIAEYEDAVKKCISLISENDPENTLFNLKLEGAVKDGIEIDCEDIKNRLSGLCLYVRTEEAYTRKYDLGLIKEENSVRGEFVRLVLSEYENESESFKNKVIEKGMKYL